jgi:hypothetical protein
VVNHGGGTSKERDGVWALAARQQPKLAHPCGGVGCHHIDLCGWPLLLSRRASWEVFGW